MDSGLIISRSSGKTGGLRQSAIVQY